MVRRVKAWRTPNSIPESTTCRALFIPDDREWLAIVSGALAELTHIWNWENAGEVTPQAASERMSKMLIEYYQGQCTAGIQPPFWDDQNGDDADGDEESPFHWYEDVADWLVTAFLATSFTPAAAIEFVTTARKLRLWFRTRDYGAIVRVLLDGLEIGTQDTYSLEPGLVEFAYDIPQAQGFSAQDVETHTLRIEHTGVANDDAVPTARGYAAEVVRKHIEWSVPGSASTTRIWRVGTGGKLQYSDDVGESWDDAEELPEYPQLPERQEASDEEKRCLASRNAAEVLYLVWAEMVDEANGSGSTEFLIATLAGLIGAAIGTFFALPFLVSASFGLARFAGVVSLLLGVVVGVWNDDKTEQLTCLLYENSQVVGGAVVFDFASIAANIDRISDVRIAAVLSLIMNAIGSDGLNHAGATTSVADYDCDQCGSWVYTMTPENARGRVEFSVNEWSLCNGSPTWGAQAAGTVGVYQGQTRWLTTPIAANGVHSLRVRLIQDLPAGTTITRVSIAFGHTSATNPIVRKMRVNNTLTCNAASTNNVQTITGTWSNRIEVEYSIQYNQGLQQGGYVNAIQIEGTGVNPFL